MSANSTAHARMGLLALIWSMDMLVCVPQAMQVNIIYACLCAPGYAGKYSICLSVCPRLCR